jgi:predicted AAA+ superfamily ATPase
MFLGRKTDLDRVRWLFRTFPIVGILGPRQIGKTTLAREIARRRGRDTTHFDLEKPADLARLADPSLALEGLRGLVVIDEVQLRPELYPVLRPLADRPRRPARFLILGSANPALLRQSSETLAGRISYHELSGFRLDDVGSEAWQRLWLRGGYPRSFLAKDEDESLVWRQSLVATYTHRDLAMFGSRIEPSTMERFWKMIAHSHGQVLNSSELARSFAVSDATVRRYLDRLQGTFMARVLPPWSENLGKRQVKAPKVYVADTGLLHVLLGIREQKDLESHPKVGASFEGFALEQVVRRLGAEWNECYFWRTHQGAELDLLVVRGRTRLGFEIKHTDAPGVTPSMKMALADLKLNSLDVVHRGREGFPMGERIRAVPISRLTKDIEPLR